MKYFIDLSKKIFNVLLPSFCLFCDEKSERILCDTCIGLIALSEKVIDRRFSYLFDKIGPGYLLYLEFKKNRILKLSKLLAAYMITKLDMLDWPQFDFVVPYNNSIFKRNDHIAQLSKEVAKFLNIPISYKIDKNSLVITDSIDEEKINKIKSYNSEDIYLLGVSFDISSNHLDLSA